MSIANNSSVLVSCLELSSRQTDQELSYAFGGYEASSGSAVRAYELSWIPVLISTHLLARLFLAVRDGSWGSRLSQRSRTGLAGALIILYAVGLSYLFFIVLRELIVVTVLWSAFARCATGVTTVFGGGFYVVATCIVCIGVPMGVATIVFAVW